jgi:hypothetical protein
MHLRSKTLISLTLVVVGVVSRAEASTIVYQNTTTAVGAFEFNGATLVGSDLAANIDINQLTLAAGTAGDSITSFSFTAENFSRGAVEARPTIYIWAADGAGGDPGTLLETLVLPDQTLAAGADTISVTVPSGLTVPASREIWAGIGFDNDNGASPITAAELDALGGLTFHPATVGADGPNAVFIGPGSAKTDPTVLGFGTANTANYGWTVQAAPTPEPSSFALLVLCVPAVLIFRSKGR